MFQDRSLVMLWSAPNYCYRCGNVASILSFDSALEREVKYFTETDENSNMSAACGCAILFVILQQSNTGNCGSYAEHTLRTKCAVAGHNSAMP